MRYNCNHIRRILDAEFEIPYDEKAFLGHVESCPGCQAMLDAGPQIEEGLRQVAVHRAPESLAADVMNTVAREGKPHAAKSRSSWIRWAVAGALYGLAAAFVFSIIPAIIPALESVKMYPFLERILAAARSAGLMDPQNYEKVLRAAGILLVLGASVLSSLIFLFYSLRQLKTAPK